MKCPYCGGEIQEGKKFCTHCGKQLGDSPIATKQPQSTIDKTEKKKKAKKVLYIIYQTLISLLICAITVYFLILPNGIAVKIADKSAPKVFSIWHAIMILIKGGDGYNPTFLSIITGFGTLLFTIAVPVFQLSAIAAIFLKKSERGIRRIAVIMTSVAIALQCMMLPLACTFIPSFKAIYAKETNHMLTDISQIISWWTVITAVLVIILMISGAIITHKKNELERGQNK